MAVGSLRVDLATLESCITALGRTEVALDAVMTDLSAQSARLHDHWRGEAASAHADAQRRWAAAFDDLCRALTSLRAVARHAHTSYHAAVEANTAMWAQLS